MMYIVHWFGNHLKYEDQRWNYTYLPC